MDKPETQAVLGQDTKWTSQRQRKHRDTCNIKTSHKMDKPETEAVLSQHTEWTSMRQRQY